MSLECVRVLVYEKVAAQAIPLSEVSYKRRIFLQSPIWFVGSYPI